ncbi:MAG TPA: hypothetical protein VFV99_11640 [Kofleriaceae bacterium]|nr:hypothetical protein [Kofleriaceae bacterium]
MARIVVIFSLVLAACDVGELPGVGGADGGSGSGDGGGNGCIEVSATPAVGHHNPVMPTGCMSAAGCHSQAKGLGAAAPAYSYGGLLYKADKMTPYAGATVIIKLGTAEKKAAVADNGEFFLVPGIAGLDEPTATMTGSTEASACPSANLKMGGLLTAAGGDCNSAACHQPGGVQGVIYAP